MKRALLALALALAPAGCESPQRLGLPSLVNVVARLQSGQYISLLVELSAPRERPTLLVSQGLVSFDGERLFELEPSSRVEPIGAVHELRVADLLRGAEFTVRITEGGDPGEILELVHLRERSALLRLVSPSGSVQWWEVGLYSGEQQQLVQAHAVRRFERYGPDRGFAVYVDQGELSLSLPRGAQGEAMTLLDGVADVVSVSWIDDQLFPDNGLSVLQRRFEAAGSVAALAMEAHPDGDLGEWSNETALSVGSAAHISRGLVAWSGARDASFALAAHLTPHQLCAAVRVRDDQLLPGVDVLTVETELRSFELEIPPEPTVIREEGFVAAFTDQASFGVGVEMCLEPELWTVHDGHVPFRVLYRDQDPGQELTLLASAPDIPWPALAGIRLPRRGREGALPPRE